jgi:hypothetical protein
MFLAKLEDDIAMKKIGVVKPRFLKNKFRAETLKKYRESGGIPPSNR